MKTVSRKAYLDSGGVRCPRCNSDSISTDAVQLDASIAWQSVWCDDCKLSWTDEYDLTGIRSVYCLNHDESFEVVE